MPKSDVAAVGNVGGQAHGRPHTAGERARRSSRARKARMQSRATRRQRRVDGWVAAGRLGRGRPLPGDVTAAEESQQPRGPWARRRMRRRRVRPATAEVAEITPHHPSLLLGSAASAAVEPPLRGSISGGG